MTNADQELKKDYVLYLSGKIIPGIVGLLSVPIFLRVFGEAVYGEFTLVYSLFLMIITSATGWLTQGIVRFYNETDNKNLFRKTTYTVSLWLTVGILILSIPLLLFFNYDSGFFILVMALLVILATNYMISIAIYQANFEAKKIVFANSIKAIIFILIPVVFFFVSPILTLLTGGLLGFLGGILFLNLRLKSGRQLKNNFHSIFKFNAVSKKTAKDIWVYGWPLTIWIFLATFLNISDRYIIDYYYGFRKAGEYSAIYDVFSKMFTFLFAPLVAAIFPILVKLYNEKNIRQTHSLLRKAVLFEVLVFSAFALLLLIFRDILITDILKIKDIENVQTIVFPIFIGSFLWQFSILLQKPLELLKATKKMVFAILFAVLINLILNILFIPIYGYIAAAYTTIIGSLSYTSFILFIKNRSGVD